MTVYRFAHWLAVLCVALIAVLTVMRDDVRRRVAPAPHKQQKARQP